MDVHLEIPEELARQLAYGTHGLARALVDDGCRKDVPSAPTGGK